ncbi:ribosomal protein S18-alanine N-acetyltransferase [Chloroflexota bacterium]
MGYTVRPMRVEDISQVSEIDREAFPTQWPPPSFRTDLNSRMIRYIVACEETNGLYCPVEVVEQKADGNLIRLISKIKYLFNRKGSSDNGTFPQTYQNIVGYAALWLMVDEAHLTSIAVRGTHRRQGVGELLLIFIIKLAAQLSAEVVTLEARTSNLEAQALYGKYGFIKAGVRRGYYSEDDEDAVIMTTETITSDSYQARFHELKREYMQRWGTIQGGFKLEEVS